MSKEIFKDVVGYEGLYQVSNLGVVKSLSRPCILPRSGFILKKELILKTSPDKDGYLQLTLCLNGAKKTFQIHKLVAVHFLNHKPCGHKLVINHKDFNRQNNHVENLEIVTNKENTNKKHLKSSSKYMGVTWDKIAKKWRSQIYFNGKQRTIGRFVDEHDAHLSYQNELKKII